MQGRFLRQIVNKFMVESEVANNARVQVYMPNGETFDVKGIKLMENNNDWHHGRLTKSIYNDCIQNLNEE